MDFKFKQVSIEIQEHDLKFLCTLLYSGIRDLEGSVRGHYLSRALVDDIELEIVKSDFKKQEQDYCNFLSDIHIICKRYGKCFLESSLNLLENEYKKALKTNKQS